MSAFFFPIIIFLPTKTIYFCGKIKNSTTSWNRRVFQNICNFLRAFAFSRKLDLYSISMSKISENNQFDGQLRITIWFECSIKDWFMHYYYLILIYLQIIIHKLWTSNKSITLFYNTSPLGRRFFILLQWGLFTWPNQDDRMNKL